MLRHERLELADQLGVPSAGQVGLDAVLEQREPQLLEPADLALGERLIREIGERRPAPERERLPQPLRSPAGVIGCQGLATLDRPGARTGPGRARLAPRGAGSRSAWSPPARSARQEPCGAAKPGSGVPSGVRRARARPRARRSARQRETGSLACISRSASSAGCLPATRGIARPASSTSSGPRIRKSIVPRYRREAAVQPACLRVVLDRSYHQEELMPTIAHRPSQLVGRAPHSLTMWILGAVLVAVVATMLALSLSGSGGQQTDPSTGAPQAAPQAPTPFGGAHQADRAPLHLRRRRRPPRSGAGRAVSPNLARQRGTLHARVPFASASIHRSHAEDEDALRRQEALPARPPRASCARGTPSRATTREEERQAEASPGPAGLRRRG